MDIIQNLQVEKVFYPIISTFYLQIIHQIIIMFYAQTKANTINIMLKILKFLTFQPF